MFYQFKLTFVSVLFMSFCLESQAVSDICSICSCENSQTYIYCYNRGLTSVPHPIPQNVVHL
uniref:LRRNT domain-containing protein n=1 Tax=Octopus bimaculoides TaxID=37653 RepID=A0A0L8FLT5_OCTBM